MDRRKWLLTIVIGFVVLTFPCCLGAITDISTVVPDGVNFDCTMSTNMTTTTYMLYKDGLKVVTAVISFSNNTIEDDSEAFSVFGGLETISFHLEKSTLQTEGLYRCAYLGNDTEVTGEEYRLIVFAPPKAKTNATSLSIFGGETVYIDCNAVGKPHPIIKWIKPKNSHAESNGNILIIRNADGYDHGIFQCSATNKYGKSNVNVSVLVNNQHPDVPTLQLMDRNETSLKLKWIPPAYLGRGSAVRKFILKCLVIKLNKDFASTELSYAISNLQPSTLYKFSLKVCNYYVCGYEAVMTFETAERGKPTKPSGLRATSTEGRNVTITWFHGQHSGQVLFTNISYWKANGDMRKTFIKLPNKNTQYRITGLLPYTYYFLEVVTCVQGTKKILCSDPTSMSFQTKIAAPSSPVILDIHNTDTAEVAVVVQWHEPIFFNGPSVSYKVHYKEHQDSEWISNDVPKPKKGRVYRSIKEALKYIIANVRPMTKYDVRISASNSAGFTYSSTKEIRTDESAPLKPQNLTVKKATHESLTIAWSSPKHVPASIDCYLITVNNKEKKTSMSLNSCKKNKMEMTIEKLAENSTYVVSIRATVRRKRDNTTLEGEAIQRTFQTAIEKISTTKQSPITKNSKSLVWATVLSLLIVVAVIFSALIYCKKKNVFESKFAKSRFYVEELKTRPLASRLSARSVERKHPPIDVEDFPDHVIQLHADSDYLFSEEYLHLGPSKPDFTWEHSTLHLNRSKNRYQDIVAYDHSRVRLMSIDGIPASNYINANFIDGFDKKPAYIATQAPLNQTIEDFWRMVWEQDARIIVMLTNLWERGKRKCDQYWPHQGELMYGNVTVRTVEERKYSCYIHRVFSITWNNKEDGEELGFNTEESKLVRQFHFTDWPDFGVPKERSSMLSYVHMVRRYMQETDCPAVVHCSAGVGRSGTFIVIEAQIERINRKKNVNIYEYIKNIRTQRNFLVQQEVQYIFIHDALVDYIKCGLTAIPVGELEETLDANYFTPQPDNGLSIIDEEWQIINEFNIHEYEMLTGRRPCNQQKNRDSFILPIDSSRVRLTVRGATDGTDYINANYIDGFYQKKRFIVTQMPLYDTMEDFWRMIWENFSEIVISLLTDEEREKEDFFDYLPRPGCNPINFGAYEIHCLSEQANEQVRVKELELVGRVEWGESEKRKVYHYQYLHWSEDELPVADHLFQMMDNIKEQKDSMDCARNSPDSSPMVVHCSCGVGRSGVYCALNNIKEQMDDFEETVDVFTTVRLMRSQRPLIIQNKMHYEYLYRSALIYKEISPKYPENENEDKFGLSLVIQSSPDDNTEDREILLQHMEEDELTSESSA